MESITSRDNRLIKEGRRLLADAKYRRQTGLFLLEGARLCADAARSGVAIRTVLVTARAREGYGEQLQAIRRGGVCRDLGGDIPPFGGHGVPAGNILYLQNP